MDKSPELLTEQEEITAKILMQVLHNSGVPCMARPVNGAGMVMRGGMQERLRIYVPQEKLQQAKEIAQDFLSGENEEE